MFGSMDWKKAIFILLLVSLFLVYYVGATAEGKVLFPGLVQLLYAIGGRNSQGNYPNYPK